MTNVSTVEALSHFTFKDSPEQVRMASEKAFALLKNYSLQGQTRQCRTVPEADGRAIEESAGFNQPTPGQ